MQLGGREHSKGAQQKSTAKEHSKGAQQRSTAKDTAKAGCGRARQLVRARRQVRAAAGCGVAMGGSTRLQGHRRGILCNEKVGKVEEEGDHPRQQDESPEAERAAAGKEGVVQRGVLKQSRIRAERSDRAPVAK